MRICIVCENVYPFRCDPSSRIAYRLASEFRNRKVDVDVLCKNFTLHKYKEYCIEDINYHVVKSDAEYNYSFKEIHRIYGGNVFKDLFSKTRLLFVKIFRKMHFLKLFDCFSGKKIKSFLKNSHFDLVIVVAGNFRLSRLIENRMINCKKSFLYATDYWNNPKSNEDITDYLFSVYDAVFGRSFYIDKFCKYCDRLFEAGPIIEHNKAFDQLQSNKYNLSYFGTFYGSRDTDSFLNAIESIRRHINTVKITLFSNISPRNKTYKQIIFKSEIYDKKYEKEIEKTNVLLVLDNKTEFQKWIPSKLYDAMAIGKPIIFFTNNHNSFALDEIKKYDLFYVINYDNYSVDDIKNLDKFLQKNYLNKTSLDFDSVFKNCNKKYLVDKMINTFKI